MNGCSATSSQCLHSSNAIFTLPIPHIVVPLCGVETVGEEGTRMQLKVQGRILGQNSPHSDIRSIGLHHELMGRVRMNQDRTSGEAVFEVPEHPVRGRGPRERTLVEVSADRGETRVL
jgi:hypothetical protein